MTAWNRRGLFANRLLATFKHADYITDITPLHSPKFIF